MKTYNTIKTTTPGTALETIPGLEVPALPEKIAKIDQAGSNEFQMKLGSSFLKFREALILALRDPMSLGLGGGEATTGATSVIPISWIVESSALKVMTNLERNKLAGIENGAQVNTVTSVQGRVGGVVVSAADLGLGNVDNTSDVNKPVSTAQATAINARIPKLGYVGVSMNGASLTADIGKMYGVYATGVTITLPSATTVGDGEVIGFMIGVNAGRTLQINTTSSQNLITPEGVKTTGYAVTGFARTIYAVCYFHTWMLCGMEDSAIAAATSNMMTVNTAQNVTAIKTFKTPFITSPDGTANYSAFSIGSNPGGLTWYLQFKPLTKELNWYTVKGGLYPVPFSLVYDPDPRAVFPISPKVPDLPAGDSSDKATNSLFVTSALRTKLDRWSYHYTVASTITGVPWRLQGFGASSTMTLPLASSVEDGTQIGALIVTGGGTVTLQRSGTDQFVTPSGLATSYTLAGNGSSIVLVKVAWNAWACLGAPDSMINAAIAPLAPLASPALTGTPTAPTAAAGENTTQIATTAFVQNNDNEWRMITGRKHFDDSATGNEGVQITRYNIRTVRPNYGIIPASEAGTSTLSIGASSNKYASLNLENAGVVSATTPPAGTNTTQLATTEFVTGAIGASRPKHAYVGITTASTAIAAERGKTYGVNAADCTLTLPAVNGAGYVDGDEICVVLGVTAARELAIISPSYIVRGTGLQPVNTPFDVTGFGTFISFTKCSNVWVMSYPGYELDSATANAIYDLPVARSGLATSGTDKIILETANAINAAWYDTTHVLNVSFFAQNELGLSENTTFKVQLYDAGTSTAHTIASITVNTLNSRLLQASIYRASSSSVNCGIQYGIDSSNGTVSLASGAYKLRVVCTSMFATIFRAAQVRFTK